MKELISGWKNDHEKKLAYIENKLAFSEDDSKKLQNCKMLCNWLLESQNSNNVVPEHSGFKNDVYAATFLVNRIFHALLDDGDITFVNMFNNGKLVDVFMVFGDRYSGDFNDYCNALKSDYLSIRKSISGRLGNLKKEEDLFTYETHIDEIKFMEDVEGFVVSSQEERKKITDLIKEKFKKTDGDVF